MHPHSHGFFTTQAVKECASLLAAAPGTSGANPGSEQDAPQLIFRALSCLQQHPSSSRVTTSGSEAVAAVVTHTKLTGCSAELRVSLLQRLLDTLRQTDGEAAAAAVLNALFMIVGCGGDDARRARDAGAIEAVVDAVRRFPSAAAVHELAWVAINRMTATMTGGSRPDGTPAVETDEASVSRLAATDGFDLALASLPLFRGKSPVITQLLLAIICQVAATRTLGDSQRSLIVKVRQRISLNPRAC